MAISNDEYNKLMYAIQNFSKEDKKIVTNEYITNGYEAAIKKIKEIIDKRKLDGFEPSI